MSNSTTTQILFNSPALHSLKRDQLVRLCKTHSLKANGKNVDLIQRLKEHAQTLPKDAPLSIAVRGEEINDNSTEQDEDEPMPQDDTLDELPDTTGLMYSRPSTTRPSEQWEVVMDTISEEEEGSSKGSLSSLRTVGNGDKGNAGEFGTGSSKSSTVGSSFKALASSLGLKRGPTSKSTASKRSTRSTVSRLTATPNTKNDELEETATPYSELPPAQPVKEVKPLAFNPARTSMTGFLAEGETPLPGHALRPGVPAPENARLSMGLGVGASSVTTTPRKSQPTTTIRLVKGNNATTGTVPATPQLKPMETTFDLIMGSPSPESNKWSTFGSIYPKLTLDDLPPSLPSPSRQPRAEQQDGASTPAMAKPETISPSQKSPEPFIFGSPHPKHRVSNVQFKSAAASVLEEMNKRLQDDGVTGVDTSIIERLHPGASKQVSPREIKPLPNRTTNEVKEKFDTAHKKEFEKMEGIDGFVKRKAELAPKRDEAQPILTGKKRKSSVIAGDGPRRPLTGRASGTRVISNGRRAKALPGAFGLVDDDDDQEEEQGGPQDDRGGKRIRVSSNANNNSAPALPREEDSEERPLKDKHHEAIKKKLEQNKARRRSSLAANRARRSSRVSGGLVQPKPKPSRFGFLSSAKSLVQSVWNRGKAPAPATSKPNTLVKPPPGTKGPIDLSKKTAAAPARSTAIAVAGSSSSKASDLTKPTIASSARSRSPIPSFTAGSSRGSIATNNGTQGSRMSNLAAKVAASRQSTVAGTATSRTSSAHVSSVGTRTSAVPQPGSEIGSMGAKRVLSPTSSAGSRPSIASRSSNLGSASSRLSTSSRLFAPTASSLAKASNRNSVAPLKSVAEHPKSRLPIASPPQRSQPSALATITNVKSPGPFSPTQGKIFSKPLHMQSGIPSPVKKNVTSSNGQSATSSSTDSSKPAPLGRQRSISGRKPRISRSKVIARLASQRAASGSSTATTTGTSALANKPAGRTRSSFGAKGHRSSLGGARTRGSGAGDVMMSAKKKARQSEYLRRRSRIEALALSPSNAMDVDR